MEGILPWFNLFFKSMMPWIILATRMQAQDKEIFSMLSDRQEDKTGLKGTFSAEG